ncbi:MAG TPA: TonB-dependent receptor [Vicinamibacteria bacterium]|jgi:hypothetical protein
MKRRVALVCLAVLGSVPAVLAQIAIEGSLRGYVKDEQGAPMPGVSLTATSPTVPGTRTAVSDRQGYYRLLDLPPGDYTVSAELAGFARVKRTGIAIRTGLNLALDIVMKVGSLTEAVTVSADTPMAEAQSAVQAVNIEGDFQRALPLNNRKHWSDFLAMTPGMIGNQLTGRTADSYELRGSDFSSHVIQFDGADMASAQQNATTYVTLPTEAISDVQVKIGTVDASSPLGVGAVINIATKSGTNDFHGAASMALQKKGWANNNNPGGTLASVDSFLPEAALGGPIVRDRLWFFGSYRHEHILGGIARSGAQLALVRALKPDFEPFDSRVDGNFVFAKLSAKLSDKHQGEASYAYDPQSSAGGAATDAGQFVEQTSGGNRNFAFRLSSLWRSNVTTRIGLSYNNKALFIRSGKELPSRPVFGSVVPVGGTLVGSGQIATLDNGNAGWSFDQPYYKYTLSGDVTYFKSGWGGGHEFQAGFYFQPKNHQESIQIYANGGFSREEMLLVDAANPSRGIVPFHREIFDVGTNINSLTDTRDFALYLQDAWHPTERLTVSAGVRADFIKRVDKVFDIPVQDHTDVGPRFGLNYAVTSDRKNIVRASWVRAHDVLSINPASAGTNTAGKRDLYDTNLDGVFETVLVTPQTTALATNRIIDLERGQPYIDEWAAGLRRQFSGRVMADAAFIHRAYKARSALVEQNGIYENGAFLGYRDERFNEIFQLTSNKWNWQVYSGLELQVVKDTARFRALASYTRAWRHIAGTWQPNDPALFIQPDAFPNDRSIGDPRAATSVAQDANSLSGTHMTDNVLGWQDHVARGGLTYNAPANFLVSTTYIFQSGGFSGPVVTRIAAADPRFGSPTVRLSNGRVVSNPLATTIRFAYPTRGEGQPKLPALHIWNLRLGRDFKLGGQRNAELAFDVFNVLNRGSDQSFLAGGNQTFSPNYNKTSLKQQPRSFRLSARLAF